MGRAASLATFLLASCAFACGGGQGGGGADFSTDTGVDAADTAPDPSVDAPGDDAGADDPALEGGCASDGDCDDFDPCTTDVCDVPNAQCSNEALDADADGYVAALGPGGEVCGGTDCDDASHGTYPGAAETCDGVDNDCDGDTMDGPRDEDGDGFSDVACTGGDDCDDAAAAVNPGAAEIPCNGVDENCDGVGGAMVAGDAWLVDEGPASSISAAWTGSALGVAWAKVDATIGRQVMFATVPAGGGAATSVEAIDGASCEPLRCAVDGTSVAWSGSEFGVAWARGGEPIELHLRFARVSGAGAKLGSDLQFSTTLGDSKDPALAWTGTAYGLAWVQGGRHVEVGIVDPAGERIGSDVSVRFGTMAAGSVSLTWSGTEFGLAWKEQLVSSSATGFTRLAPDGSPAGVTTMIPALEQAPELLWTGSEFSLVSLGRDSWLYGIGVTAIPAGGSGYTTTVVFDPFPMAVQAISARWSGQEIGIGWVGADASSEMTVSLHPASPSGLSTGAQATVDAAGGRVGEVETVWTGSSYVVLWTRGAEGLEALHARAIVVCPED